MADDQGSGKTGRSRKRRRRNRGRRANADRENNPPVTSTPAAPNNRGAAATQRRSNTGKKTRKDAPQKRRETASHGPRQTNDPVSSSRPQTPTGPSPSAVDLGWDEEPIDLPPEQDATRPRGRLVADSITWGDDSGAPEPSTPLVARHPKSLADDDDPSTALLAEASSNPTLSSVIANIAGIRFVTTGKIYDFDAGDEHYDIGERVSVEGDRAARIGEVVRAPTKRPVTRPLKRVLRRAPPNKHRAENGEKARDQLIKAKEAASGTGASVKIFRVESRRPGGRTTVYFSSETKVDQRALARALTTALQGPIELRQTGVRDEAKMVGGIGSCGRELCCSTWLPAFVPVSIKHAKDQGLALNPSKVSGQCGRLKCCLVYEQAAYAEARKGLPRLGKRVITSDGEGRVVEVNALKRQVRVNHGDGRSAVLDADDVKPMFPSQPAEKKRKPRSAKTKRVDREGFVKAEASVPIGKAPSTPPKEES